MIGPDATLKQAKDWLRSQIRVGARCPCCTQYTKVYRRRIYSKMATLLIKLYRMKTQVYYTTDELVKMSGDINFRGGDFCKLSHWELIETRPNHNDETKKQSGLWRITEKGREFAGGKISVKSHVIIYDNRILGFDGKNVFIKDCFGKHFNYTELMNN